MIWLGVKMSYGRLGLIIVFVCICLGLFLDQVPG